MRMMQGQTSQRSINKSLFEVDDKPLTYAKPWLYAPMNVGPFLTNRSRCRHSPRWPGRTCYLADPAARKAAHAARLARRVRRHTASA